MLMTIKAVITMIIQSLTQIHKVSHVQIQSSVRWILCVEDVTLHRKYEGILTNVQTISQLP